MRGAVGPALPLRTAHRERGRRYENAAVALRQRRARSLTSMRGIWMSKASIAALFLAAAAPDATPEMGWPEAIRVLAAERTRAEGCATLLKRYAGTDTATLSRGEANYTLAKAEFDGVVAALSVALAQSARPESFERLQSSLEIGIAARQAFCETAVTLAPPAQNGTRDALIDVLGGAIEPLVNAAKEIFFEYREAGELERVTIKTQLEATKWLPFSAIDF